jgi:hypothetical protein
MVPDCVFAPKGTCVGVRSEVSGSAGVAVMVWRQGLGFWFHEQHTPTLVSTANYSRPRIVSRRHLCSCHVTDVKRRDTYDATSVMHCVAICCGLACRPSPRT